MKLKFIYSRMGYRVENFNRIILCAVFLIICSRAGFSQSVNLTVNGNNEIATISPLIYGKNGDFSNYPSNPTPAATLTRMIDAGLRFSRMNAGNNATKYNWRRKLTCHSDWYQNIYGCDWDYSANEILTLAPRIEGFYAFQLIGKAAKTGAFNFPDWCYNGANWTTAGNDWAGGGGPSFSNTAWCNPYSYVGNGGDGDPNLYLEDWNEDSTTGILDHWFTTLGYDQSRLRYWNMDNEADIWDGTHNDVMPTLISASAFMDNYITIAQKARAKFPGIKLCGPVATAEWQWYKWGSENITISGQYYSWLEYFIKRCADEEIATGVRVLDVVDLHNYPYAPTDQDALQLHRIYYDQNYVYPGINGVKTVNGGWDNSQKEYIFKRINDWLNTHYGVNHGIKLGISEWGPSTSGDPNVTAVVYASSLGVFADNGVDFFTPWIWAEGMWETLNLFSNYYGNYAVQTTSSLDTLLSGYSSLTTNRDTLVIAVVNRDMSSARTANITLQNVTSQNLSIAGYQIANLPSTETFVSKSSNALQTVSYTMSSPTYVSFSVPKLSITLIRIPIGCIPLAANAGSDVAICQGSSTTLNGLANGCGTHTYSWSPSTGLSNASIANPVANPSVTTTYTLTVSDGVTSATDNVTVTVNTATSIPFSENFSSGVVPPTGWTSSTTGSSVFAATGSVMNCPNPSADNVGAWVNTRSGSTGTAELITPTLSFANSTNTQLTYDYVMQGYDGTGGGPNDKFDDLAISIATCGSSTFNTIYNYTPTSMVNTNGITDPTNTQCQSNSINLSAYDGQSGIRLKFSITDNDGNNFYIDNININGNITPLPIALISFEGILSDAQTVSLSWKVAKEENIKGYKLFRTDNPNTTNWKEIAFVPTTSNVGYYKHYSYLDNDFPLTSTVYYKLICVEKDGKNSGGNIISVHTNLESTTITAYPNPSESTFTVEIYSSNADTKELRLLDVLGVVVEERIVNTQSSSLVIGENLSSGVYFLQLTTPSEQKTIKLIKH